jgi:hypothetical protein
MDDIICPECEAQFTVIWQNSIDTQDGPQYCPFCGAEMDYTERT